MVVVVAPSPEITRAFIISRSHSHLLDIPPRSSILIGGIKKFDVSPGTAAMAPFIHIIIYMAEVFFFRPPASSNLILRAVIDAGVRGWVQHHPRIRQLQGLSPPAKSLPKRA